MAEQRGFSDDGTNSARPCQLSQSNDYMNEYDEDVAHPGNRISTLKRLNQPNW
jgi:hypothetical protein